MLEKLLKAIKESGTTSPALLAEYMGTTPKMITAMLDTLEEQGYLRTMTSECNTEKPCESCSLSNLCSSIEANKPRIRVFEENLKKA